MLNVGSDYSGVGAFDQALLALNISYKKQFVCDYNEYARKSYVINYGTAADKELVFSKEHQKLCKKVTCLIEKTAGFEKLDATSVFKESNEFSKKFSFYYPFNVYNREIPQKPLDVYMTSPPCQGFSLAGKREGSILFFNSLEFIQKNKPRFFIFENVKGLLSHEKDKKNKKALYGRTFNEWTNYLGGKSVNGKEVIFPYEDSVPYHIYFHVMNAKEYGVPQNRERVFIIGIRDDEDNNFQFPKTMHLTKRLKDVLEKNVDEKYFLSDNMLQYFNTRAANFNNGNINFKDENDVATTITSSSKSIDISDNIIVVNNHGVLEEKDIVSCIDANYQKGMDNHSQRTFVVNQLTEIEVGTCRTHEDGKGFRPTEDNMCPTIAARGREDGSGQPVIKITENPTILGYTSDSKGKITSRHENNVANTIHTSTGGGGSTDQFVKEPMIGSFRGRNEENPKSRKKGIELKQTLEINENGTANALTTVQKDNVVLIPKATINVPSANKKGFEKAEEEEEDSINLAMPNSETRRGRVGKKVAQTLDTACNQGILTKQLTDKQIAKFKNSNPDENVAGCLTEAIGRGGSSDEYISMLKRNALLTYRIRRLTPTECFRLMDFAESFIDKIKEHNLAFPKQKISDSQLYKQAGNSIVKACLVQLLIKLNVCNIK